MNTITTPNIPIPRTPLRVYPIGVKDRPPLYLVLCTDGTMWELVRDHASDRWEPLPPIPIGDGWT